MIMNNNYINKLNKIKNKINHISALKVNQF